jgi:hypothetical protein
MRARVMKVYDGFMNVLERKESLAPKLTISMLLIAKLSHKRVRDTIKFLPENILAFE